MRIWVLFASIAISYGCASRLNYSGSQPSIGLRKVILLIGLATNLGLLAWFKYYGFFTSEILTLFGFDNTSHLKIALPLGISFFVFQSLSAVIDAYRSPNGNRINPLQFAAYVSFFPQLIAGPIVRWNELETFLKKRHYSINTFNEGIRRFIIGLAKKILIANQVAPLADSVFARPLDEIGVLSAWLGCLAYAIQILYDFSGYSDMAIGLGLMFGIRLPENFRSPYQAQSMRDFWRRWHITLSRWFRDYLYIPLGGNRQGSIRTILNLAIVFALCGFWHGANWNFIIWGLAHGLFLSLERFLPHNTLENQSFWRTILKRIYVGIVVLATWAIFRSNDMEQATALLRAMAFLGQTAEPLTLLLAEFSLDIQLSLLIGVAISVIPWRKRDRNIKPHWLLAIENLGYLALFLLCIGYIASDSYNPFIYFRF